MSTARDIGRGIVESTRFLTEVYKQLSAMLETLDEEMKKAGWAPPKTRDAGGGLGNRLDEPTRWLPSFLARVYSPRDKDGNTAVVVLLALSHPELQEAVAFGIALGFTQPMNATRVWDGWKHSDTLVEHLATSVSEERFVLSAECLNQPDCFEGARTGLARAVPLVSLSGPVALRETLVQPLLHLAHELA